MSGPVTYYSRETLQEKLILAGWVIFWIFVGIGFLAMVLSAPVSAIDPVINPSVDNQPLLCRYSITKWACPEKGINGATGINGTPGLPGQNNFSAMFWNSSNFTTTQNQSTFYNSSNFTAYSNYTIYQGASITINNGTVNESYAYLPGRAGGQTLTGGNAINDDLVLNASSWGGTTNYVVIQPKGGNVGIGSTAPDALLVVRAPGEGSVMIGGWGGSDTYGAIGLSKSLSSTGANLYSSSADTNLYLNVPVGKSFNFNWGGAGNKVKITGANLTLGLSSYTAQLHTTGSVRFQNCSGTPTFDAGGNLTCSSDEKLKTSITPFTSSLSKINLVNPISWTWKPSSGYVGKATGFSAQNLQAAGLSDAVIARKDVKYVNEVSKEKAEADKIQIKEVDLGTTTLSVDQTVVLATAINAIKELSEKNDALEKRVAELEARLNQAKL